MPDRMEDRWGDANQEEKVALERVPELVHAGCLVFAGQSSLVTLSVASYVQGVLLLQLLDLLLDGIPSSTCMRHKIPSSSLLL